MAIAITSAALTAIKMEMARQNLDPQTVYLRMGIQGGGCSGLSYHLEFDTGQRPNDKVFSFPFPNAAGGEPPLTVLIGLPSYMHLNGATLDYIAQGLTGGFTFANPNAKSSCGCGHSFSS